MLWISAQSFAQNASSLLVTTDLAALLNRSRNHRSNGGSSIAGHFGLNIYILSLSTINEASLKSLFDKLPSSCIILLEDINAVSSNRDAKTEDSRQIITGSPSRISKSVGGKVTLSSLLNVIDSVGLQEGRIVIYIIRLNKALI
jgi:mitochondrial chaperone BCS1